MNNRPFSDHSYERFLQEEKIMGSQCSKCGALAMPPRPICVSCLGNELEWIQFRGVGKLAAFTRIIVAPPFMAKEGFSKKNPYLVGVVELEESVKFVARITGIDTKNPEEIKVRTPLQAEFIHSGQGPEQKIYLPFIKSGLP
jgi:uncharacterized OB-fold protein